MCVLQRLFAKAMITDISMKDISIKRSKRKDGERRAPGQGV